MLFALISGTLALAVGWWLVRPLVVAEVPTVHAPTGAAAWYRQAIAGLEDDARAGLITARNAEGERAALARALLAAPEQTSVTLAASDRPLRRLAFVLLAATPIAGGALYLVGGGNLVLAAHPHVEHSADTVEVEQLARKLSERVARAPDDAEGYRALGIALSMLGRSWEAAQAYRTAIALGNTAPEIYAALGSSLTDAQHGISADALDAFNKALEGNADEPTALLFRGEARYEMGDLKGARDDWGRLLDSAPEDAPWRQKLAERVAVLDRHIASAAGIPQGGEDIAAMDPADRGAAIEGMVARLATRLEADPRDLDGWLKLIRSYTVLGETEKAQDARATARRVFSDDPAALQRLAP